MDQTQSRKPGIKTSTEAAIVIADPNLKSEAMSSPKLLSSPFTFCVALFLLGFCGTASAQSTETGLKLGQDAPEAGTLDLGPTTKTQPAPKPQPAATPPLSAAPGLGGDLERTTYGAWEVACAKGGQPCVMAQIGKDKEGTPVLEMVVRKLPTPQEVQGVPVVSVTDVITPLGVVLTSGLVMQIDSSPEQRAPFQICTEQGCLVREPLTEEAVLRFKRGNNARITVVAAQQGPVASNISLAGFTKAYGALK